MQWRAVSTRSSEIRTPLQNGSSRFHQGHGAARVRENPAVIYLEATFFLLTFAKANASSPDGAIQPKGNSGGRQRAVEFLSGLERSI
jgi:hypothetical protein